MNQHGQQSRWGHRIQPEAQDREQGRDREHVPRPRVVPGPTSIQPHQRHECDEEVTERVLVVRYDHQPALVGQPMVHRPFEVGVQHALHGENVLTVTNARRSSAGNDSAPNSAPPSNRASPSRSSTHHLGRRRRGDRPAARGVVFVTNPAVSTFFVYHAASGAARGRRRRRESRPPARPEAAWATGFRANVKVTSGRLRSARQPCPAQAAMVKAVSRLLNTPRDSSPASMLHCRKPSVMAASSRREPPHMSATLTNTFRTRRCAGTRRARTRNRAPGGR